jgi:putative heme-binding domain-containing protein
LTPVGIRPVEALLSDIINPNVEVGADYFGYSLVTKHGRILTGVLANESATGVTLRTSEGNEVPTLRSEIEELRHLGRTLMPDGLEKSLGDDGVWDVIAYLREPRRK